MNEIGCYILFSDKLKNFYVGACQNDLQQRINNHNQALYGSKCFTAAANDWRLIIFIQTENY